MKSTKKQLYTTVLGLGLLNVLSSCNDSFMDRFRKHPLLKKSSSKTPEIWNRIPMVCMDT